MADALPKHVLLVKLLKMTTSDNDGEALSAMRKANALLTTAGWDWDKLMSGKITVVEDPFGSIGVPKSSRPVDPQPEWANPNAGTRFPNPPPPPQPAAPKHTTWPLGQVANKFAAACWCCGAEVLAGKGFIFKPGDHSNGPMQWKVACTPCNMTAIVANYAAPIQRTKRKANVTDLA